MIALLCLVLSICGVGLVLALAYGSIQARDWNRKRLIVIYSACIAVTALSAILCIASGYELLTRAVAMPA